MSQLRELAIEQYAEHYARLNVSLDPHILAGIKELKRMDLQYGSLIAILPQGSKILDLGCGTGYLLYWLSKYGNVIPVGVDSSISQVKLAQNYLPDTDITCEDGLQFLRTNSNSFSGIFCMDVLEHLPTLDACLELLEAIQQALLPGGFFVCRVPNAANLTGGYSRYIDLTHERAFTSLSLLQLLEIAELQNCQTIPIRAGHLSGRIRLALEGFLHKIVFRICGQNSAEKTFTYNICAVGFKK
ncbi:MAG: methyltransferase domain-containing protein [Nostoc sp.]|uniref:class I SAM-dependent methyltransferase n=1 Tax=Nostoc sp. TaxID=1180 RepID=UPI002FF32B9D